MFNLSTTSSGGTVGLSCSPLHDKAITISGIVTIISEILFLVDLNRLAAKIIVRLVMAVNNNVQRFSIVFSYLWILLRSADMNLT